MKVLYVITSCGNDIHTALTRVSLASVRLSNPEFNITVVCDAVSDVAIRKSNDPICSEVDNWIAVETPDGEAIFRNRYMKTSLCQHVHPPFIFLDSDTFVRKNLAPIFDLKCDIAGAINHSTDVYDDQVSKDDEQALQQMKWDRHNPYLNGGVTYYGNTEGAKTFSEVWHQNWLEAYNRVGLLKDQPSLNKSLLQSSVDVHVLPHAYNAQIFLAPLCAPSASIWHFYSADIEGGMDVIQKYAREVEQSGEVSKSVIAEFAERNHPWPERFWEEPLGEKFVYTSFWNTTKVFEDYNKLKDNVRAMNALDRRFMVYQLEDLFIEACRSGSPKEMANIVRVSFLFYARFFFSCRCWSYILKRVCGQAHSLPTREL